MTTLIVLTVTTFASFLACISSLRAFAHGYIERKVEESENTKLLKDLLQRVEVLEGKRKAR